MSFWRWVPPGVVSFVRRVGPDRLALTAYLIFAICLAIVTTLPPHLLWAKFAVPAYAIALAATFSPKLREWAFLIALVGALAVPLVVKAAIGMAQPEVNVLIDGARSLLHHGTPYLNDPAELDLVRPYFPALFVFGLPRALGLEGVLGDPRIWIAVMAAAIGLWIGHSTNPGSADHTLTRVGMAGLALPLFTLNLSVSAIDIPMTILLCAALVFYARGSQLGLALTTGVALAMKPTVLAFVAIAFIALLRGRSARDAFRFVVVTGVVAGLLTLPVIAVDWAAFVRNCYLFPAGLFGVETPAQTRFPGVMLSWLGDPGRYTALALMALALIGSAVYAWLRPPQGARQLGYLVAIALSLAFMLAPASRAGYFVLPVALWLVASRIRPAGRPVDSVEEDDGVARGARPAG